jgi:acyl-CoA synthetase (AMP-forming)/AMP-acid ligase II
VERAHAAVRPHCSAAFALAGDERTRIAVVVEVDDEQRPSGAAAIDAIRRSLAGELDVQLDLVAICSAGSVPKTTSGKVQRRLCGELLREHQLDVIAEWSRGTSG